MCTIEWQRPDGQTDRITHFVKKICTFCIAYPDPPPPTEEDNLDRRSQKEEKRRKFYDRFSSISPVEHPHSITEEDITVANGFGARTSKETWHKHNLLAHLAELETLDPNWDLFENVGEEVWQSRKRALRNVLERVMGENGSGIAMSSGTKVLHLKRPKLIPICDSVVVARIAGRSLRGTKVEQTIECINIIRKIGQNNIEEIETAADHLRSLGEENAYSHISPLRILDAVLWFDTEARRQHWSLLGWD